MAAAQFGAVDIHPVVIVGLELAAGGHPLRQGQDAPGVFLACWPVAGRTGDHQPAHRVGRQGVVRFQPRQGLYDHGRAPDVAAEIVPISLDVLPMGATGADDDAVVQIGQQRILVWTATGRLIGCSQQRPGIGFK